MNIKTKFNVGDIVFAAIHQTGSNSGLIMDSKPYVVRNITIYSNNTKQCISYRISPPQYEHCDSNNVDESLLFSSFEEGNKTCANPQSQTTLSIDRKFKRRWTGNGWKEELIS